jgi:hypothetical protein
MVAWGVAAVLIAAAFVLGMASVGDAVSGDVIDPGTPIESSQCAPCHLNVAEVKVPGLIFSHGNHLLVSCDGCHSRMPHRDGVTEKVPMEVCFACHGVAHGPQGDLATGKCQDCHTSSFKLRPRNHSATWAKKPHAENAKRSGVNSCMMCHEAPKDCDKCHARLKLDIPKMPAGYHSVLTEKPKGPSMKIYPNAPVTMAQCVYCHADLDAITPGRLIFAHSVHIQRNYRCEACHETFSHTGSGIQRPDMQSCYRCHGVYHNGKGLIADGQDCGKCHPKSFELVPADHTRKFRRGDHGKRANSDPAYCAMCHASQFCIGCHRGQKVSPNAPGKAVVPADHKKTKWKAEHGGIFMHGQGSCASCHTGDSCRRCHKTTMPHPVGWSVKHSPEPGVSSSDCNICHKDRSGCQKCHHEKVERGELIAANCTPCHKEMKQQPPTSIKNKTFAEHAVHFSVAKRSAVGAAPKDEPYTCAECHIGFYLRNTAATRKSAGGALLDAGHDVRLCYGCHGQLNYQNVQIAPWRGASLCLRCHSDLNL